MNNTTGKNIQFAKSVTKTGLISVISYFVILFLLFVPSIITFAVAEDRTNDKTTEERNALVRVGFSLLFILGVIGGLIILPILMYIYGAANVLSAGYRRIK